MAEAPASAPWQAKKLTRPQAAPYQQPYQPYPDVVSETPTATYCSNIPSCPPKLVLEHSPRMHGRTPVAQSQGGTAGGRMAPVSRGSVRSCLPSSTANSATDQLTAIEKIEIFAMICQIYAHVYPEHHAMLTLRVGFMTLGHKNPVELYLGICRLHGIKPVPEYSGQRRAAGGGLADSQTTTAHRQAPL